MKERSHQLLKNGFFMFHRKHIHTLTIHIGPIAFSLHPEHDDEKGTKFNVKFLTILTAR